MHLLVSRLRRFFLNCRLRSVEQSSEIATRYNSSYQTEMNWLDNVDSRTKSISLMESGRARNKVHPHMVRYYIIEQSPSLSS